MIYDNPKLLSLVDMSLKCPHQTVSSRKAQLFSCLSTTNYILLRREGSENTLLIPSYDLRKQFVESGKIWGPKSMNEITL